MTRVLFIDVETRPALAYVWSLNTRYINPQMVKEPKRLLCFAWMWLEDEDTGFASEWSDGRDGMARRLHELLSEADFVVGWNSKRFDVPIMVTEIMLAGLDPPAPFEQIDLLAGVRKRFSFMSNRLGEVAKILDTSRKLENSGFQLWLDCMDGKREALAEMEEYNRADVVCTRDIYLRLKPWWPKVPNVALIDGTSGECCTACNSTSFRAKGYQYLATGKYRRFVCTECGRYFRSRTRVAAAEYREVV